MASSSRLCALVSRFLLPQVEPELIRLTRENEKNLLISLTLVSREIKKLVHDPDCVIEENEHSISLHLKQPLTDSHNCTANIVSVMVALLTTDSQFVQHLSESVLMLFSEYLLKCEKKCVEFLHLLWTSIEAAVSSLSSSTSFSSAIRAIRLDENIVEVYGTECSSSCIECYIALSKSRLASTNWPMVSSLFRVIRNILKSLRSDHEDLVEVYTRLAVSSLLKLPWDMFSEVRESQTSLGRTNSENGDSLKLRNDLLGCKRILLATIVQVLCSLVEHKDSEADQSGPLKDIVVYCRLTSMIPQILRCCFPKCCTENQLSQYFKHKTLLLMIRLSFYEFWHKAFPLSWLRLVIEYFGDLVFYPITDQSDGINPLEDSPFIASFSDGEGVYPIRKRHLQRQALFLYLRCCFALLNIRDGNQDCIYPTPGLSSARENSSFTVSLELSEWFHKCALLEISVDSESHSRKCYYFALLFLQLYMEEDDMLFQMLLQLLDAPIPIIQVLSLEDRETYKGLLFHLSRIFHPIHLLHLLLLLIHYDHLLLVDYLISKDTGVHCLHYLLRCLRIICKSWKIFVEFSIHEGELIIQPNKRRKVSRDEEQPCYKQSSSTAITISERQNVRKNSRNRSKENSSLVNCFEDAKKCLLSLKRTVEDLHRKKLFPYNPKPLLKSLTRFQELC